MARGKTFWELMQTDVSLSALSSLFNGKDQAAVESHADEIIEFAESEAARRGKPVEIVLAEMGFTVGGEPSRRPNTASIPPRRTAKRNKMLETLQWVPNDQDDTAPMPPVPKALPTPEPVRDKDAEDKLLAALEPLEQSAARGILEGLTPDDGNLGPKLTVAGAIDGGRLRKARNAAREGAAWWTALLDSGVAADLFAEVLSTEPNMPPKIEGGLDVSEYLLDNDHLRYRDLKTAANRAKEKNKSYIEILLDEGKLSDEVLFEAVAELSGLETVTTAPKRVARTLAESFPIRWVRAFEIVPVKQTAEGITVVSRCPLGEKLKAKLETAAGAPVQLKLAPRGVVASLANAHMERWEELGLREEIEEEDAGDRIGEAQHAKLKAAITERSAVEVVRKLVDGALEARASDIHLEPLGKDARVRYRIDGILHDVLQLRQALYEEVLARIKILADLDITERRRPQDGHIAINIDDKPYDLRIASLLAKLGEKMAIRIADAGRGITKLDQLGLSTKDLATVQGLTRKPFGMLLAAGPVGSGKTTSLYACLGEIDRTKCQIVSIEDPVEIALEGTNQVEVNYDLGVDFVIGLRALLRQDPDVILVGEIRDDETAKIAVRASMTGLLVMSTLHTNDTTGTITALRNFDIPHHLISSSLLGVIAQRLIRLICPKCKRPQRRRKSDADSLGLGALPKGFSSFEGKGCEDCFNTGYHGRTGVFEVFPIDHTSRGMILDHGSEREIRDYAIANGMLTLQQDGLEKVKSGATTVAEFERVLRL